MKHEIDHKDKIGPWLEHPVPAVFQGQDLRSYSSEMVKLPLSGCVFLGCLMGNDLAAAAATAGCYIIPVVPKSAEVPFDPFTPGLYTPAELFDKFKTGGYSQCYDRIVYESYIDPVTKEEKPVDVDVLLLRRVHDWSIADALDEALDKSARLKTVAIMGGHDVPRDKEIFATVATLGLELANAGYIVLTGGGPGLMEAGNLGAYCSGFADPYKTLTTALARLADAPTYDHKDWLAVGYEVWEAMGEPTQPDKSRNVGIPTWFYGHEPPNMFATQVAKYFENSVREEGLLAVALGGVIFADGNAGTVQEIFQDACQNYYRTYAKKKSPMVLFGREYWSPKDEVLRHDSTDLRKKVYPVVEKLAAQKGFSDYLLITDSTTEILKFIKSHPPA